VIRELADVKSAVSIAAARAKPPSGTGLYAIFIDRPERLPSAFSAALKSAGTRMIYVGRSEACLNERLLEQDLQHARRSTFFRGIGAVLGYQPPAGSLRDKANKNNYRFSAIDTRRIIDWLERHVTVQWVPLELRDVSRLEKVVIRELCPLLNKTHNRKSLRELGQLRAKCRRIACR
jgi:hypothetical protein